MQGLFYLAYRKQGASPVGGLALPVPQQSAGVVAEGENAPLRMAVFHEKLFILASKQTEK